MDILYFVFVFAFFIIIHELGHLLSAKLVHINVKEFGIGFPPRIAKLFTIGGTDFTLNALPLGGFVVPAGENDPAIPGGLAAASPLKRLFVLVSGSAMNLLTAFVLFTILIQQTGMPLPIVQIQSTNQGDPAEMAGLQAGDKILEVNGTKIEWNENLRSILAAGDGQPVTMKYQRGDQVLVTTVKPVKKTPEGESADRWIIGITMSNMTRSVSALEAMPYAALTTLEYGRALIMLPSMIISGNVPANQKLFVGIIGIFDEFRKASTADKKIQETLPAAPPPAGSSQPKPLNTLGLIAVLSAALGFTNLLPFPGLDGGHILFTLPELLFRRRIPPKFQNYVQAAGLALLVLLMVAVNINDLIDVLKRG